MSEKGLRLWRDEADRGTTPKGEWAESENIPAVATGDHDDIEMDGRPAKNGDMDARGQPALPCEKLNLCQYSGAK